MSTPSLDTSDGQNIAAVVLYTADGRFVLQQRDDLTPYAPNKLCLFGGHIKHGERPLQAIRRELREELSAHLTPRYMGEFHNLVEPDSLNLPISFYVFASELKSQHFKVYEGSGAKWLTYKEILERPEEVVTGTRKAVELYVRRGKR